MIQPFRFIQRIVSFILVLLLVVESPALYAAELLKDYRHARKDNLAQLSSRLAPDLTNSLVSQLTAKEPSPSYQPSSPRRRGSTLNARSPIKDFGDDTVTSQDDGGERMANVVADWDTAGSVQWGRHSMQGISQDSVRKLVDGLVVGGHIGAEDLNGELESGEEVKIHVDGATVSVRLKKISSEPLVTVKRLLPVRLAERMAADQSGPDELRAMIPQKVLRGLIEHKFTNSIRDFHLGLKTLMELSRLQRAERYRSFLQILVENFPKDILVLRKIIDALIQQNISLIQKELEAMAEYDRHTTGEKSFALDITLLSSYLPELKTLAETFNETSLKPLEVLAQKIISDKPYVVSDADVNSINQITASTREFVNNVRQVLSRAERMAARGRLVEKDQDPVESAKDLLNGLEKAQVGSALRQGFSALLSSQSQFLDIGAGNGVVTAWIAPLFEKTVVMEQNQRRLEMMRKHRIPNLTAEQGDFFTSIDKYPERSFDAVLISHGLIFIPFGQRDEFLRKVVSRVSDSGRLAIVVNSNVVRPMNQVSIRAKLMKAHRISKPGEETNLEQTLRSWGHAVNVQSIQMVHEVDRDEKDEMIALVKAVLPREDRLDQPIADYVEENLSKPDGSGYRLEIDEEILWVTPRMASQAAVSFPTPVRESIEFLKRRVDQQENYPFPYPEAAKNSKDANQYTAKADDPNSPLLQLAKIVKSPGFVAKDHLGFIKQALDLLRQRVKAASQTLIAGRTFKRFDPFEFEKKIFRIPNEETKAGSPLSWRIDVPKGSVSAKKGNTSVEFLFTSGALAEKAEIRIQHPNAALNLLMQIPGGLSGGNFYKTEVNDKNPAPRANDIKFVDFNFVYYKATDTHSLIFWFEEDYLEKLIQSGFIPSGLTPDRVRWEAKPVSPSQIVSRMAASPVIPAKAGINSTLDPRLKSRGDDASRMASSLRTADWPQLEYAAVIAVLEASAVSFKSGFFFRKYQTVQTWKNEIDMKVADMLERGQRVRRFESSLFNGQHSFDVVLDTDKAVVYDVANPETPVGHGGMKLVDVRLVERMAQQSVGERFQRYVNVAKRALEIDGGDDYFVKPTLLEEDSVIREGDSAILFNFRGDRAEPIIRILDGDPDFKHFPLKNLGLSILPFGVYDDRYFQQRGLTGLLSETTYSQTLGEVLSQHGKTQLRIAESEKYKHVTYFFDGLRDLVKTKLKGFVSILVPSNKIAHHDEEPQMKADEITDRALPYITGEGQTQVDFIVINYANMDILGHFDNFSAAVEGALTVDKQVGRLKEAVEKAGGTLVVTGDHGSGEIMAELDEKGQLKRNNKGQPVWHKAHAFDNKVPFIVMGAGDLQFKENGSLRNVAPTILELMGISKPKEMDADSLLVNYQGGSVKGPVVFVVRDGWGLNKFKDPVQYPEAFQYDAIYQARLKARERGLTFYADEMDSFPHTELWAHGEHIGHPAYQMGDSENGHFNMGAGRKTETPLKILDDMLASDDFAKSELLRKVFDNAKKEGRTLHLIGMVSEGGVHSHIEHLHKLLGIISREQGLHRVFLHAIFDGRDVMTLEVPGWEYLKRIGEKVNALNPGFADKFRVGSIAGRYYPMDRDGLNRDKGGQPAPDLWLERTLPWYELVTEGKGRRGREIEYRVGEDRMASFDNVGLRRSAFIQTGFDPASSIFGAFKIYGDIVLLTDGEGNIQFFDVKARRMVSQPLKSGLNRVTATLTLDDEHLLLGSSNGDARIFDVSQGKPVGEVIASGRFDLEGITGASIAIGDKIFLTGKNGNVRTNDRVISTGVRPIIESLQLDDRTLLLAGENGRVQLIDINREETMGGVIQTGLYHILTAIRLNESHVLLADYVGRAKLFNVKTHQIEGDDIYTQLTGVMTHLQLDSTHFLLLDFNTGAGVLDAGTEKVTKTSLQTTIGDILSATPLSATDILLTGDENRAEIVEINRMARKINAVSLTPRDTARSFLEFLLLESGYFEDAPSDKVHIKFLFQGEKEINLFFVNPRFVNPVVSKFAADAGKLGLSLKQLEHIELYWPASVDQAGELLQNRIWIGLDESAAGGQTVSTATQVAQEFSAPEVKVVDAIVAADSQLGISKLFLRVRIDWAGSALTAVIKISGDETSKLAVIGRLTADIRSQVPKIVRDTLKGSPSAAMIDSALRLLANQKAFEVRSDSEWDAMTKTSAKDPEAGKETSIPLASVDGAKFSAAAGSVTFTVTLGVMDGDEYSVRVSAKAADIDSAKAAIRVIRQRLDAKIKEKAATVRQWRQNDLKALIEEVTAGLGDPFPDQVKNRAERMARHRTSTDHPQAETQERMAGLLSPGEIGEIIKALETLKSTLPKDVLAEKMKIVVSLDIIGEGARRRQTPKWGSYVVEERLEALIDKGSKKLSTGVGFIYDEKDMLWFVGIGRILRGHRLKDQANILDDIVRKVKAQSILFRDKERMAVASDVSNLLLAENARLDHSTNVISSLPDRQAGGARNPIPHSSWDLSSSATDRGGPARPAGGLLEMTEEVENFQRRDDSGYDSNRIAAALQIDTPLISDVAARVLIIVNDQQQISEIGAVERRLLQRGIETRIVDRGSLLPDAADNLVVFDTTGEAGRYAEAGYLAVPVEGFNPGLLAHVAIAGARLAQARRDARDAGGRYEESFAGFERIASLFAENVPFSASEFRSWSIEGHFTELAQRIFKIIGSLRVESVTQIRAILRQVLQSSGWTA